MPTASATAANLGYGRMIEAETETAKIPIKKTAHVVLTMGSTSHGGVFAVNEAQSVQGIFERGRDDGDFLRREDLTSVKKRPNRHSTNPRTRTSTTSTSWLKVGIAVSLGPAKPLPKGQASHRKGSPDFR